MSFVKPDTKVVTYPRREGLQWPLFQGLFLLDLELHFPQEMRLAVGLQMCSRAAVDMVRIVDQVEVHRTVLEVRRTVVELVPQGIPTEILAL